MTRRETKRAKRSKESKKGFLLSLLLLALFASSSSQKLKDWSGIADDSPKPPACELTKPLSSCNVRVVVTERHDSGTYLITFQTEAKNLICASEDGK
jgi:hypothetical protein